MKIVFVTSLHYHKFVGGGGVEEHVKKMSILGGLVHIMKP